ncbi:MAG: hypothetical protein HXL32_00340 [Prevotellaceae bacterium]|nr:hypothetical protein [Prevotellaceae bacterium]
MAAVSSAYDDRHTHCTAAVSSVDDGRRTMNKSRKTCCQYSKTGMTNRLFATPVTVL